MRHGLPGNWYLLDADQKIGRLRLGLPALLQQELSTARKPLCTGDSESGRAASVLAASVGLGCKQHCDNLVMAPCGSDLQRQAAFRVARVRGCLQVQQKPNRVSVAMLCRTMEWAALELAWNRGPDAGSVMERVMASTVAVGTNQGK